MRLNIQQRGGKRQIPSWLLLFGLLLGVPGCDVFTDAATRLASDLEAGSNRLGKDAGSVQVIRHVTPSKHGECEGPYTIQVDRVGALILWCKDAGGQTVSSHSTSYHARFVDTPRTYLRDKPAGSTLTITLERRGGRAVIVEVQ